MIDDLSAAVWDRLRCVECGRPLKRTADGAVCSACGHQYPRTKHGSLDMRLKVPKTYSLEFKLVPEAPAEHSFTSVPLQANPAPQVDFAGLPVPRHLTPEILSYFPKARGAESLMLDLGCGEAVHKQVAERAGFEWVGVDYGARRAPILGDAQAIPFDDGSFEFILCVTVLQYVQFPFVAMREAFRVLKPGGVLIGSAAFLEPSHGTSFYHPSHVGIYNLLTDAGFSVRKVAPFATWPALKALASMGLFYRMPRAVAQALVAPLQFLHAAWWRFGSLVTRQDLEKDRLNHFAGSFSFIASREV
jgi:SAM-dependent methyltransferase